MGIAMAMMTATTAMAVSTSLSVNSVIRRRC